VRGDNGAGLQAACQLDIIQGKLILNFINNKKKHLPLWAWGQIDNQYNDASKTITVSHYTLAFFLAAISCVLPELSLGETE
jgi:hypothetical protein